MKRRRRNPSVVVGGVRYKGAGPVEGGSHFWWKIAGLAVLYVLFMLVALFEGVPW